MLGEERKEGNAGVSNSNKSSNAEQFLPVPSWSVDPIPELTGLCLVALAVGGEFAPVIIHLPPQRCRFSIHCLRVKHSWPVRRYFPAAPWPVTTAWPPGSYSHPQSWGKSMDQLAWNGDAIEMNDCWANFYSSLYGTVMSGKLNW